MTNPLVCVTTEVKDGAPQCRGLWIWCPGCESAHRPRVALPDGTAPGGPPIWTWNGATDASFTIEPSLLVWTGDRDNPITRCHSFIRNGVWDFLSDCTHDRAGMKLSMVPIPDWLCRT